MGRSEVPAVTVGDLQQEELPLIGWSGSATHLRNVAGQLDRRDRGVVEYLVVRDNGTGELIAKGAIDYEEAPDAGTIIQLATRPDRVGQGHARRLIAEAERRIRERGLNTSRIAVEPDNRRAWTIYESLSYIPVDEQEVGWEYEREDGEQDWYRTTVVVMEKRL